MLSISTIKFLSILNITYTLVGLVFVILAFFPPGVVRRPVGLEGSQSVQEGPAPALAHLLRCDPGPGILHLPQANFPPRSPVAPPPPLLRRPDDVHQVAPHQPSVQADEHLPRE